MSDGLDVIVVDDDPAGHGGRRVEREADETLVHVDGSAARGHAHEDPGAGIPGVADGLGADRQHRRVLAQHLVVHDESAGAEHHLDGLSAVLRRGPVQGDTDPDGLAGVYIIAGNDFIVAALFLRI